MFKEIQYNLPAGIVVFFGAVPLFLGIALTSGAPLFAGIIVGIVGGILVGFSSGSAFFTKASLLNTFSKIPNNASVIINGTITKSIAFDVLQLIREYKLSAQTKNINVETIYLA